MRIKKQTHIPKSIKIQKCRTPRTIYDTGEWYYLKSLVYKLFPKECMKCSAKYPLSVDHIKPVSKNSKKIYDLNNLQILCLPCNKAKSNHNNIDYRTEKQKQRIKDYARIYGEEVKKKIENNIERKERIIKKKKRKAKLYYS